MAYSQNSTSQPMAAQTLSFAVTASPIRRPIGLMTNRSSALPPSRLARKFGGSARMYVYIYIFIHSGHFYSAPSSSLPLRGAPDYSTDTVSEFHAEAHRQLQVKDLPKVPT